MTPDEWAAHIKALAAGDFDAPGFSLYTPTPEFTPKLPYYDYVKTILGP